MKAVLLIGNNYKINKLDFKDSYVVGIDKGALICLKNNIKMDLAIGDFDSINKNDYENLKNSKTKIIKLNEIKDDTDTEYALKHLKNYDEILILGGITGKRIEHFIAMLNYIKTYTNVILKDDNSIIYSIEKDEFIKKDNEYKYISFFSLLDDTIINLEGFKYNLKNYNLKQHDSLCISNEINSDYGIIKLKGRILIIKTKDDSI